LTNVAPSKLADKNTDQPIRPRGRRDSGYGEHPAVLPASPSTGSGNRSGHSQTPAVPPQGQSHSRRSSASGPSSQRSAPCVAWGARATITHLWLGSCQNTLGSRNPACAGRARDCPNTSSRCGPGRCCRRDFAFAAFRCGRCRWRRGMDGSAAFALAQPLELCQSTTVLPEKIMIPFSSGIATGR